MNGLRIALVGPLPPPAGGTANQTVQLAALLRAAQSVISVKKLGGRSIIKKVQRQIVVALRDRFLEGGGILHRLVQRGADVRRQAVP
ncbi:hypothetical protein, partial [Duganella margarita]|uniref:hypothetical protein n=1 Tax=Duganella margarita TaxID=2692170 RepID=UPI0019280892